MRHARTLGALLCVFVSLGALVGVAGSASPPKYSVRALTPDSTFTGAKSISGGLAETDRSLLGRSSSNPVNVVIKYDYDATASYAGGVSSLAPTSPRVTGRSLKANPAAVRAYEQHTSELASEITASLQKAVPDAHVTKSFQKVYGGVAARVPANAIDDLLEVDGIVAVQKDTLQQPQTSVTPEFVGATAVWPSEGGSGRAASNVVVGILDTGIWPEHPSFADPGLPPAPGGPYGCEFGDGTDTANLGATFSCNRKLVGAYAFTDTYMAIVGAGPEEFCNDATNTCSPRDAEGHGTHTASIAAGSRVASTPNFGKDWGPISGIAPGARVIAYRVCLAEGCFSSDSVAAVQQAIVDEIDVINFSVGGGADPYSDPVELAFLDAFNAGISVNAAAGNSGPDRGAEDFSAAQLPEGERPRAGAPLAATSHHGGPWVTTVGASSSNRQYTSTLRLTADGGARLNLTGYTVTPGISSPTPVILAEDIPGQDRACLTKLSTPAQIAATTGKIVACERGTIGRIAKGFNLQPGGAAGMILYNPIKQDVETDNHWLPTIHVDGPPTALRDFIDDNTNVRAEWAQGMAAAVQGDVMAYFSSRGPQADFLKPDITAPGVQILAGMTPDPDPAHGADTGPPGKLFQAIAGTSMSSPHAAGASALVKAAHPDWSPAAIKSALMTSAAQGVVKPDGSTPADPFDAGAGSLRVNRAVNPTLVFDESFEDFVASASDPLHRVDLNIASVDAPTMTGELTTKRTATNVSGRDVDLHVDVEAPAGSEILVSDRAPGAKRPRSDREIELKKRGTTDIWITISAPELPEGQYFGRITLDPEGHGLNDVTIPVAFYKRQGVVSLTHECAPTTFPRRTGVAHCLASVSNLGSTPAEVDLTVRNLDKRRLAFTNVSAPATASRREEGVEWSGTLTPALGPKIESITRTTPPAFGYIPLKAFGVPVVSGASDESIANFDVPTFYFGTEAYTRIGVVSNGYVVVGGGTAEDVAFTPQSFPDPARPNNVIAPLWTDLNPGVAGEIRVGALADGVDTWLIVDWAGMKNWGNATTHTFELWIRLSGGGAGTGPASEEITITYGPGDAAFGPSGNGNAALGDPAAGVNWGAENRDASSGKGIATAPPNGSEYDVETSAPIAGGSATITYDASSRQSGTYKSVASMTSNVTPGTTQVVKTLTVTGG